MKTIMKLAIILLIFSLVIPSATYSQAVVLVRGHVKYKDTGKPADVKIVFIGPDKKKVPVGSQGGFFKQALQSGVEYAVFADDHLVIEPDGFVKLDAYNKYQEIDIYLTVEEIKKGTTLLEMNLFEANDSTLAQSQLIHFSWLMDLMLFQRDLKIEVVVNSGDSYFKSRKVKQNYMKNGKPHSKWVTLSNDDQLKLLIDSRISELKDYLKRNRFRDNLVVYTQDFIPTKRGKKSDSYDVKIIVHEIFNF